MKPSLLHISQKIAKSMANNGQLFDDLHPSACLLRAATAISGKSEHWCTFDTPHKATPIKQTCLLVIVAQWCLVGLSMKLSIGT